MNKKELNDYYTIESDRIFQYRTDINRFDSPNECLLDDSRTINQYNYRNISLPQPNLVDIESDLTNRTRHLSKNPEKKFNPKNNKLNVEDINKQKCEKSFVNKKVSYKTCYIKDGKMYCN